MLKKITSRAILLITPVSLLIFFASSGLKAQDWPGVDETVVEKFAEEQGRKAWKPLINTDQGDLLLFAFLLAGSVGGFILGFYWRALFVREKKRG